MKFIRDVYQKITCDCHRCANVRAECTLGFGIGVGTFHIGLGTISIFDLATWEQLKPFVKGAWVCFLTWGFTWGYMMATVNNHFNNNQCYLWGPAPAPPLPPPTSNTSSGGS